MTLNRAGGTPCSAFELKLFIAALALSALAVPAFADAIDGNWCHNDGRRFTIRGPEIVTPGGKQMEGQYSRHWFNYTVPAPEPGAGQTIYMMLAQREHRAPAARRGRHAGNLGALRAVDQRARGCAAVVNAAGS